jgi:probable HAF family extracellular repeat protein
MLSRIHRLVLLTLISVLLAIGLAGATVLVPSHPASSSTSDGSGIPLDSDFPFGSQHSFSTPLLTTTQNYTITDLGPAYNYEVVDVNNAGQVVGGINFPATYQYSGGVWQNDNWIYLGDHSGAVSINNAGQVAGECCQGQLGQASIWSPQGWRALPTLIPGGDGMATAINDAGQAVGTTRSTDNNGHAVFWQNNQVQELPMPPGSIPGPSVIDLNNRGQAIGEVTLAGVPVTESNTSVLWSDGGVFKIDPYFFSNSINDSGVIAGRTYNRLPIHAMLYPGGDLGTLGGPFSEAWDINNTGQVVGESCSTTSCDYPYSAFLWDGTMVDLNRLIPPEWGWHLTRARGINDLGWIVGEGYVSSPLDLRSFLLIPPAPCASIVPEQASFGLSGGTGTAMIKAPDACIWTAATTTNWITITSSLSGQGNGAIHYTVAGDLAGSREGAVTLSVPGTLSKPTLRIKQGGITIVDPNPVLINTQGQLINNPTMAASLTSRRIGAAADGVSRLLLVADANSSLTFSLEVTDTLPSGTLADLRSPDITAQSVTIPPSTLGTGESKVVAVYTPPNSFGATSAKQRLVNVRISDASNPQAGSILVPLKLKRPPVVLVHGLWSEPKTFEQSGFADALRNRGFSVFLADYSFANAATFDPNSPSNLGQIQVKEAIIQALNNYRDLHLIAATQADVIAHSMGGLMTRALMQQPNYYDPINYNEGWIHRFITMGTPHQGTGLANLLWGHRDDLYVFEIPDLGVIVTHLHNIMDLFKRPIDQGAIEALSIGSTALQDLQSNCNSTKPVPWHAIAGDWAPDGIYSSTAWELSLKIIAQNPLLTLNSVFGGPNDLYVPVWSQYDGLSQGASNTSYYSDTVHSIFALQPLEEIGLPWSYPDPVDYELHSSAIHKQVASLLSISNMGDFGCISLAASPSEKAPGITTQSSPAQLGFTVPISTTPSMRITEPVSGTTFLASPGTTITITVAVTNVTNLKQVVFWIDGIGMINSSVSSPYSVNVPVPPYTSFGGHSILALARDPSGQGLAATVNFNLLPSSSPEEIRVQPNELALVVGSQQQLLTLGKFSWDNLPYMWQDISSANQGTTYSPQKGNQVVEIGINGLLKAKAPGTDSVLIRNGSLSTWITVNVLPVPSNPQLHLYLPLISSS